jgi:hypothetical protein
MVLIVAALATYIWLTERSTVRVPSPPPPLPPELVDLLLWMRLEITQQNEWSRARIKERLSSGEHRG